MKYQFTTVLMLAVVFSFACERAENLAAGFPTPPSETVTPTKPLPKLELKPDADLEKQIARIAAEAKGKVGVAAVVLETGESASLNADQHFPMQSVYKLPISMAVMDIVKRGELDLDEQIGVTKEDMVRTGQHSPLRDKNPNGGAFTIRELIRLALVESDGTASDVLIRVAGGADAIQNYLTQIGIRDMQIVNTEKEIGRDWQTQYDNWATPTEAINLLRWLDVDRMKTSTDGQVVSKDGHLVASAVHPLSESEWLFEFMSQSTPGAKRLKGLLPPGVSIAHKTGTSGTQKNITAATNDIGIISYPSGGRFLIAVFVSDSSADETTREAVIARIAKAVWDKWTKN